MLQNPQQLLAEMLKVRRLGPDQYGHSPLHNFEHFCAYSGCDARTTGDEAFAWAKLAYGRDQLPPAPTSSNHADGTVADDSDHTGRNATTVR
jgi:hypothetical protein